MTKRTIQLEWPIWYLPHAPLGGAVRYLASLSSQMNWVGIYILKGRSFKLGPHLGETKAFSPKPLGKLSDKQRQNYFR